VVHGRVGGIPENRRTDAPSNPSRWRTGIRVFILGHPRTGM